jgi:hypothetical protein
MNTKDAERLLKAIEHEPGGCKHPCEQCAAMLEACGTIDYNAKDTLRVAIKLAEALEGRPESEHDGGCSAGISKLPCKCSQKDSKAARAEWKKLGRDHEVMESATAPDGGCAMTGITEDGALTRCGDGWYCAAHEVEEEA